MNSQKFYSTLAPLYDWWLWLNGYQWAVRYFVRALPIDRAKSIRVLDAGAGTGLYTLAILKYFPNAQVIACDLNELMLNRLRKNLTRLNLTSRVQIIGADIRSDIVSLSQPVDLIITGGVLEHVPQFETIRTLARHLKSGGMFLNSPVKDNFWGRWVGRFSGFRPYPRSQNLDAFLTQGFTLHKSLKLPLWLPIARVKDGDMFIKTSSGT